MRVFFLEEKIINVSAPIKINENKRCFAAFITQIRVNSLVFLPSAITSNRKPNVSH